MLMIVLTTLSLRVSAVLAQGAIEGTGTLGEGLTTPHPLQEERDQETDLAAQESSSGPRAKRKKPAPSRKRHRVSGTSISPLPKRSRVLKETQARLENVSIQLWRQGRVQDTGPRYN